MMTQHKKTTGGLFSKALAYITRSKPQKNEQASVAPTLSPPPEDSVTAAPPLQSAETVERETDSTTAAMPHGIPPESVASALPPEQPNHDFGAESQAMLAFKLMEHIGAIDNKPAAVKHTRKYWFRLYRRCYAAIDPVIHSEASSVQVSLATPPEESGL